MRLFKLVRERDVSGTSGIGIVAQGVVFDDGVTVLRWLTDLASTAVYESLEDLIGIHGHHGATRVEMIDDK